MSDERGKMSIVAFGCGNMAAPVLTGLWNGLNLQGNPSHWTLYTPSQTKALMLADKFHGTCLKNLEAIPDADVYILGMKPQQLESFAHEVSGKIPAHALVISMLAGVGVETLQRQLDHELVLRVMPNTPCELGLGVLPFFSSEKGLEQNKSWPLLLRAFESFNKVIPCQREAELNLLTPYCGSGPAYFYEFVQTLADDLSARGLEAQLAQEVMVQTCLGAAQMMSESGESPQALRDKVTSKAGVTAEALHVFQRKEQGLAQLVREALDAAHTRNAELNR